MSQKHHVMHGRDHLPGGADPIPGLFGSGGGGHSSYQDVVAAVGTLRGYWRLGEAASPFADTASNPAGPFPMTASGSSGSAYTPNVTGALPAGDDDGALQWNNAGVGSSDRKIAASSSLFNAASGFTVAAWVKPTASLSAWRGGVFGNEGVISSSPSYMKGWVLEVEWTGSGTNARFVRSDQGSNGGEQVTSAPVTPGNWHHLVATYDGTTRRLYVDGALADSDADSRTITGNPYGAPKIGHMLYYSSPNTVDGPFYGAIDEVAYWGTVLTDADVLTLYQAGVNPDNNAASDKVWTADGSGGTSWEYPTVNVDGTRYDELVTGSRLTATDNLDGTVTVAATEPDAAAHVADTSDAHDSSAISIVDSGGYFTSTDVEGALQEIGSGAVGGGGVDAQSFATPGTATWTKPAGCTMVEVVLYGGGGGGGGGGKVGSSPGGPSGGGGGGACTRQVFRASDLPGTVTVTVGSGGTHGNGVSSGNGNDGAAGGSSTFGSYAAAAGGGGGFKGWGSTGSAAAGGSGGGRNTPGVTAAGTASAGGDNPTSAAIGMGGAGGGASSAGGFNAEYGGGGGGGGSTSAATAGGKSIHGGGGGGGGGSITSGGAAFAGAAGGAAGNQPSFSGVGGTAGTAGTAGGAGGAGTNGDSTRGGSGGGGGGANTAGNGGAGGQGGTHGGGGGGGGSGFGVGNNGGNGGDGGRGHVYVYAW